MSPPTAAFVVDTSRSPRARLRPVPLAAVTLTDSFWTPRRELNNAATLPSQYRRCEESGRLRNFQRAAGDTDAPFAGMFFNDSDVYKWLEAAASSFADHPTAELAGMVDNTVGWIERAQRPDGYLNSYFSCDRAEQRWTNPDLHEMYCAGHLFQAAALHWRVTGSDRLLQVARRFADHLAATFVDSSDRRTWVDGHEEIKLALVELFRATGERHYLDLARHFLEARGHGFMKCVAARGTTYFQDDAPFRELQRWDGHSVRAMYYACGAADVLLETGDETLYAPLVRLWERMTRREMYVTGGIGARWHGEEFGRDFELPNERAYAETCAAIGSVMWNWRMLALDGEARYADLLEWTLYNAVMPGVSLDGQHYFYQNPLASDGAHRRQGWFGCACCPPNIARLLAQLPAYLYSVGDDRSVWVHLYAEGEARLELPVVGPLVLRQETRYPWDGTIRLAVVAGRGEFTLRLRVPAWCDGAALEVNGSLVLPAPLPGTYAEIRREWQPGDAVLLRLPMPVRRIEAHPYAMENAGRAALARGPILYCVEAVDHPGVDLRDAGLDLDAPVHSSSQPDLPGISTLEAAGFVIPPASDWSGALYRTASGGRQPAARQPLELIAVPYLAWANRAPGRMQIWLQTGTDHFADARALKSAGASS